MTAVTMDGKALSAQLGERLRLAVENMKSLGVEPTLATILVGDDPGSKIYVSSKHKAAERLGIRTRSYQLGEDSKEGEVAALITALNSDSGVNGILLQLPLPPALDERTMLDLLSPEKDVDGLTTTNTGRLTYGGSDLIPCTPKGIMELLHHYNIPIRSSRVVIVNRSPLVGKPLYSLLLSEDATVTICHSKSTKLGSITKEADILITAVGRRPQFTVTSDMVKEGAVVIDVAMNRIDGKLTGDVDFEEVSRKASHITPVPGGVGPMTVIMLMQNTVTAARNQNRQLIPSVPQR